VTDVDRDVKALLEARAEEMRLHPAIPDRVLRRARRRRAGTALVAGVVAAAAVVGVFAGARLLLQETTGPSRDVRPAGTPGRPYPFIYPPTQEQLDTTIAEVAQGSMPMWTTPEGVATLFAVNVLDWDMEDVEVAREAADEDEVMTGGHVFEVTNPALAESAGVPRALPTRLFILQVPRTDPMVYAVIAAESESTDAESIGPDLQFRPGGTVGFIGQLPFVPRGARVELTIESAGGDVRASTIPHVDGTFQFEVKLPEDLTPEVVVSIALLDRSAAVLALSSARVGTAVEGESKGEGEATEPRLAIPPRVQETREAILTAAQAHDWAGLRALIPDEGFTFSFGGETDPIRYWKRLESQGHVPVIGDILPAVLATEPGFDRGVFVWPAQASEDPANWDDSDLEALSGIHAEEDIRAFQEAGLYYGWRVGIDRDGTWVFFVSGD
jgi:hypothetical protein